MLVLVALHSPLPPESKRPSSPVLDENILQIKMDTPSIVFGALEAGRLRAGLGVCGDLILKHFFCISLRFFRLLESHSEEKYGACMFLRDQDFFVSNFLFSPLSFHFFRWARTMEVGGLEQHL